MTLMRASKMNSGPINGKIGWTLEAVKQFMPLFWVITVLWVTLGFRYSTPGQDIADARERIFRVEELVESLVRLECARIDGRDARLANLNCDLVSLGHSQ